MVETVDELSELVEADIDRQAVYDLISSVKLLEEVGYIKVGMNETGPTTVHLIATSKKIPVLIDRIDESFWKTNWEEDAKSKGVHYSISHQFSKRLSGDLDEIEVCVNNMAELLHTYNAAVDNYNTEVREHIQERRDVIYKATRSAIDG